jgi:hypothetical protein
MAWLCGIHKIVILKNDLLLVLKQSHVNDIMVAVANGRVF